MKIGAYAMVALLVLGGCATQEPAKIVEAKCESPTCEAKLEQLRQKSGLDLAASQAAREAADDCGRQKGALEQQLQALKEARTQADVAKVKAEEARAQAEQAHARAEKGLSERSAELARCQSDLARSQGDLAALQDKARADAVACDAMRTELEKHAKAAETKARQAQRMRELEKGLRQRLQGEIGDRDVEIEQLRSRLTVRVLDRILFNTGSAEILPKGRRVLDAVAAALAEGKEIIRVEGHADIVPIGPLLKSKYYSNWELSTGRASSVARYFQHNHGIEPTRMEAVGFSKYRPIAPNDTEVNRQRNRRVEIVLTPWKPGQEEGMP